MLFQRLKQFRYMQCAAAISAATTLTCLSSYVAWPSPSLPNLEDPQTSPIGRTITDEEGSWVVSLFLLGGVPMSPLVALLVEKLGRKLTLLSSAFFYFVPWMLILFGDNIWYIYAARFIGGFGSAITFIVAAMYIGEISDPDIRGMLGTAYSWMKLCGNFIVLSVGPFVSYNVLAIILGCFPIAFFASFAFMPESPHYLVKRNRRNEAKDSLRRLAVDGIGEAALEKKLRKIEEIVSEDLKGGGFVEFAKSPNFWKLFAITIGIRTFECTSGYLAVKPYLQSIIAASGSTIPAEYSSIIFGAIEFPSALSASILVDRLGRKPLYITSGLACSIAMIAEGVYFYLQDETSVDVSSLSWLPTTAIAIYIYAVNIGIMNLPFVLVGELYPANVKGIAVSFSITYKLLVTFLVSKFFATISDLLGRYTMFWIFGGSCLVGAIFVLIVVPETKGKSFDQIQQDLLHKKE